MPDSTKVRHATILLIDDNMADIRITQEAFDDSRMDCTLLYATKGNQALAMLRQDAPYSTSPRPDIILLDLNLPGIDGRELLAIIKDDPALCTIPVIVLSSSKADRDIADAYAAHANCFVAKPVDMDHFAEIVKAIDDFWFSVVELPAN